MNGWKAFGLAGALFLTAFFAVGQPIVAKNNQARVEQWFERYNEIRHEAQMSDAERERSRGLMAQGVAANFLQSPQSARDKQAAAALLTRMVDHYRRASTEMRELAPIPETRKLYDGYSQYFQQAGALFSDYLKVQTNLFATDAGGNGLVGQLAQRKCDLESLDAANKELDARLRAKFTIPAYPY